MSLPGYSSTVQKIQIVKGVWSRERQRERKRVREKRERKRMTREIVVVPRDEGLVN